MTVHGSLRNSEMKPLLEAVVLGKLSPEGVGFEQGPDSGN